MAFYPGAAAWSPGPALTRGRGAQLERSNTDPQRLGSLRGWEQGHDAGNCPFNVFICVYISIYIRTQIYTHIAGVCGAAPMPRGCQPRERRRERGCRRKAESTSKFEEKIILKTLERVRKRVVGHHRNVDLSSKELSRYRIMLWWSRLDHFWNNPAPARTQELQGCSWYLAPSHPSPSLLCFV